MPSQQVECRSNHAYVGYPLAFYWQNRRLEVVKIISEKQDPAGYSFRVLTEEFGCFDLYFNLSTDEWSVEQN
jgi:hypothetical protein